MKIKKCYSYECYNEVHSPSIDGHCNKCINESWHEYYLEKCKNFLEGIKMKIKKGDKINNPNSFICVNK